MTVSEFICNSVAHLRQQGLCNGGRAVRKELQQGVIRRVFRHASIPGGTCVLDRGDWDVLVVLDACRVDALQEVAPDFSCLPDDVGATRSTAGMSEEWLETQFGDDVADEKARTAHVTWNAFASHCLDDADWASVDHLYRSHWDDELGAVRPETVVDRGLQRWREGGCDRLILHMMQPHRPYRQDIEGITRPSQEDVGKRDTNNTTIWALLRRGAISHEEVWDAYLDNLRWGIEAVEDLLAGLEPGARVVVTADHGECFGEWGLYGHVRGVPVPELIRVPWVPVEATGSGYDPMLELEESSTPGVSTERLAALGYLEG